MEDHSPALGKGERVTELTAGQIAHTAEVTGHEVLVRIVGNWNTASSTMASMSAAKAFEQFPSLTWFTRRLTPEFIGVFVKYDSV